MDRSIDIYMHETWIGSLHCSSEFISFKQPLGVKVKAMVTTFYKQRELIKGWL